MRRRSSIRLVTLVAVILALALCIPANPSGRPVLAHIDDSCRFYGQVVLCCQNLPPGTVVTLRLEDPVTGPSWTTTTYNHLGRSMYVIDIPADAPPEPGGIEGEKVYFSITWQDAVFTQVIQGPSSTWRRVGFVHHPLRLGTLGDANLDGVITDKDLEKVDFIRWGQHPETPCADVNQKGTVDIRDRRLIERIIDGVIEPPDC